MFKTDGAAEVELFSRLEVLETPALAVESTGTVDDTWSSE